MYHPLLNNDIVSYTLGRLNIIDRAKCRAVCISWARAVDALLNWDFSAVNFDKLGRGRSLLSLIWLEEHTKVISANPLNMILWARGADDYLESLSYIVSFVKETELIADVAEQYWSDPAACEILSDICTTFEWHISDNMSEFAFYEGLDSIPTWIRLSADERLGVARALARDDPSLTTIYCFEFARVAASVGAVNYMKCILKAGVDPAEFSFVFDAVCGLGNIKLVHLASALFNVDEKFVYNMICQLDWLPPAHYVRMTLLFDRGMILNKYKYRDVFRDCTRWNWADVGWYMHITGPAAQVLRVSSAKVSNLIALHCAKLNLIDIRNQACFLMENALESHDVDSAIYLYDELNVSCPSIFEYPWTLAEYNGLKRITPPIQLQELLQFALDVNDVFVLDACYQDATDRIKQLFGGMHPNGHFCHETEINDVDKWKWVCKKMKIRSISRADYDKIKSISAKYWSKYHLQIL